MHKTRNAAVLTFVFLAACSSMNSRNNSPRPITIDTHADTPSKFLDHPFDTSVANSQTQLDFVRMKEGGLDAEFLVAYVPARYAGNGAAAYCTRIMAAIRTMIDNAPELAEFADSTAAIQRITASGKRAVLIGIEGGHAIEDSLDKLRGFYRDGARYMTLTHTNSNNWADSSKGEPLHNGLTPFGREVVREMNRLGMLVDISHVSDKTFYDVIETSNAPVIASHSSARALADVPRNMTDDMLRALARNGGVVMVNFNPPFLSNEVAAAQRARDAAQKTSMDELKKKYLDEGPEFDREVKLLHDTMPLPRVPWTAIVDHIDHIVKIAGIDHVGLGSDFDGIENVPEGMEEVSKLSKIPAELARRGYSREDIDKIMGGNFMRVFAAVESRKAPAQS